MRQELKRIEATLHHLTQQQSGDRPRSQVRLRAAAPMLPAVLGDRPPTCPPTHPPTTTTGLLLPASAPSSTRRSSLPPLLTKLADTGTPTLPRLKVPSFTNHRNAPNPALAMNLLKELQIKVAGWQKELQQVLRQIQDLYLEGPIVDGWLESYAQSDGSPRLPSTDVGCLVDYVGKMPGGALGQTHPNPPQTILSGVPISNKLDDPAGYRLCGLNPDGQLWFRHCPPTQLPGVSLAIARYQRLRHLLARKQTLEINLSQLAETLVKVHGRVAQMDPT